MSRIIRLLLGVSLVTLGASIEAIGLEPWLVLCIGLGLICLAFPDRSWDEVWS